MPRPRKKTRVELDELHLTAIAKAEDLELAKDCVTLLRDNDIEAWVESPESSKESKSVTVKVPESRFNEAYMLIQAKISPEGFFDIYKDPTEATEDPTKAA